MDSIPQSKRCLSCDESDPTQFHKDKVRKDGLCPYCKTCIRERNRQRYERNGADFRARAKATYHKVKHTDRYRKATNLRTGAWARRNPDKRRSMLEAWRAANADHCRIYNRQWRKAHPEQVREVNRRRYIRLRNGSIIPFTHEQLEAKMAYWGHQCWLCGRPQQAVDHVKPIAKGGLHILANLRPICNKCNRQKSAKWPYP